MDIEKAKEFKHLLFEGPVKFSFTKRDGTIREALGTLNYQLVPKAEAVKRYVCWNIEWKADEEKAADLPSTVRVRDVPADIAENGIKEFLKEQLVSHYGVEVKNFEFEEHSKKCMPADSVLFYDLERGGFRSCKVESVISFEAKA